MEDLFGVSTALTEVWTPVYDVNITGFYWSNETLPNDLPPYVEALKQANKITLTAILVFLMFGMGCVVTLDDFREVLRSPMSILVGMLCQFVLMPLAGFCLALILSLSKPFAIGVLVMSCCPGGTVSNLFAFWTNADVCLSISMTTLSMLAAIGMMPLNLFVYSRVWTDDKAVIPFISIITSLIAILIPVALGMLVRWKKKEWTPCISNAASVLGLVGIVISITLTAIMNPSMYVVSWRLWICVLSLPALSGSSGYVIARVLRRSHRHCRTIAFETGFQNVSLGMTLIVLTFDKSPIMFNILIYPALYGPVMMMEGLLSLAVYKVVTRCMGTKDDGAEMEAGVDSREKEAWLYDKGAGVTQV